MTPTTLTPTEIRLGAEHKDFSLDRGNSIGATVEVTYKLPTDTDPKSLKPAILLAQKELDALVINTLYLRGAINNAQRKQHIEEVNERYTLAGMPSPTKDPEAT
jgi:hypothetical protein